MNSIIFASLTLLALFLFLLFLGLFLNKRLSSDENYSTSDYTLLIFLIIFGIISFSMIGYYLLKNVLTYSSFREKRFFPTREEITFFERLMERIFSRAVRGELIHAAIVMSGPCDKREKLLVAGSPLQIEDSSGIIEDVTTSRGIASLKTKTLVSPTTVTPSTLTNGGNMTSSDTTSPPSSEAAAALGFKLVVDSQPAAQDTPTTALQPTTSYPLADASSS